MKPSNTKQQMMRWMLVILALVIAPGIASAQKPKSAPSAPKAPAAAPKAPAKAPAAAPGARPGGTTPGGAKPGGTTPGGAKPGGTTGTTGTANRGTGTTTGTARTNTSATTGRTGGATNTSGKGTTPGGAKPGVTAGKGGSKTVTTASGTTAHMDSKGRVTSIQTSKGATINRAPNGARRVTSSLPNHGRLVSEGRHGGYAEHPYNRGGHAYMRRTYYRGGRAYAYGYRGYYYHGGYYYGYVSPYYYNPGFYGWAYNPWAAPVAYSWGWGASPWYGYYGYYFNPYPVYASAALWMTDYVISQNLQAAYEAQAANANAAAANANAAAANANAAAANANAAGPAQGSIDNGNAGPAAGSAPALTPEVKEAIAEEVKAQLAAEKDAAAANASAPKTAAATTTTASNDAGGTPPEETPAALDPNHRTFIVSSVLTEQSADGSECALSPGDVVTRIEDTADANKAVKVLVSSSQKSDCHSGTQVAVQVEDLQEMHNHFRETLDSGLKTLADNQGKNGMPAAPSTATTTNPDGQVQPDLTVQSQLASQEADADQAEKEVQQTAAAPAGQGND